MRQKQRRAKIMPRSILLLEDGFYLEDDDMKEEDARCG